MQITLNANPDDAPCCIAIESKDHEQRLLIQTDWDYPGTASTFGWDKADCQPDLRTAYFNRFSLDLTAECVADCSHSGQCDDDVAYWASKLDRPPEITPTALAAELKEYGSWDDQELSDDAQNWRRLIWLAAGNIQDDKGCKHEGTDGTIDCPECGLKAGEFIAHARKWMDDNDGATAEDPGYFDWNNSI